MRYPILIEPGTADAAFGVVVPDLPGCFSAGDTLDEAVAAAGEAALDAGQPVPPPSSLEATRRLPDYDGWLLGVVEVDPTLMDDTIERVNITLPKRALRRLDDIARSKGQSRGAFIAELTLSARPRP